MLSAVVTLSRGWVLVSIPELGWEPELISISRTTLWNCVVTLKSLHFWRIASEGRLGDLCSCGWPNRVLVWLPFHSAWFVIHFQCNCNRIENLLISWFAYYNITTLSVWMTTCGHWWLLLWDYLWLQANGHEYYARFITVTLTLAKRWTRSVQCGTNQGKIHVTGLSGADMSW